MNPVVLPANLVRQFYRGGRAIREFRGLGQGDEWTPEDWVASVTTRAGSSTAGLSTLPDGRLLAEEIGDAPACFLGRDHVSRWGADPALLTKLLSTGERLLVHCHPDQAFARQHLGSSHGKTEAWVVLATDDPGARVYLGFREAVSRAILSKWVSEQDTRALLANLNPLTVAPGDAVLVPAGLPHAIGAGIFVAELQEPSDLSVLLEWHGFPVDGTVTGHLGLGFDVALDAVDCSAWTTERLRELRGPAPGSAGACIQPGRERILPKTADSYFRAERLRPAPSLELGPAYAVLIVTAGSGTLTAEGQSLPLRRGNTVLVPYGAGTTRLAGDLDVIRCLPPVTTAMKEAS